MKNYINEAKRNSIIIYRSCFDDDMVTGYTLYKENNHVMINYLSGHIEHREITPSTVEQLNEDLDDTLKMYCDSIFPKIRQNNGWKWGIVYLDLLNALLQFSNQKYISGSCWLTCAGLYYLQIHGPLKLKREMQLVSWINENKDKVNELIREEVESKIEKPVITAKTLNIPTYEYPKELVPYPEHIYEEGINLNNIDSLSNRQLRKIKRKVLAKERKNK